MAELGLVRLNGRRVERAHQKVVAGAILTIPIGHEVRIIEVLRLPARRGPASEATSCYRVLDEARGFPIAAANRNLFEKGDLQS